MGNFTSNLYWEEVKPEYIPPSNVTPGFDPNFGFKAPRKPRVSKLSEQEMKALQLEPSKRDYCAHLLRDHLLCVRQYRPIVGLCNPELEKYKHCEMDDLVLRMKEYERERRLRIREMKKQGKVIE